MSNQNLSRRRLLGLFGLATGASIINPYAVLCNSILDGIIMKANAQAAGLTPRRYLNIQQPGAPSRWTFDLFLTPYSSTNFIKNAMVGTEYVAATEGGVQRFTNVKYTTYTYTTKSGGVINVPMLWKYQVPRAGSGTRPMTDLLDNLLCLQGITTNNAGHPGSQSLHFRPTGAVKSMGALSADDSTNPISAVNVSALRYLFLSKKGKTAVNLGNGGNIIKTLLDPFMADTSTAALANVRNDRAALNTQVNRALASIDKLAIAKHQGAVTIAENRLDAEDLLQAAFSNVDTAWTQLLNKYSNLISRAIDPTQVLAGINNLPIGTTAVRDRTYQFNNEDNLVTAPDLRTMITSNSRIQNMAEHFAVAEYILVNDLSSSITISPRTLSVSNANVGTHVFDEHQTGKMPVLYLNSMYNRAFASCLLELIDRLKAKGIFDETVIDVGGEFNRNGGNDGFGSDHGWMGKSVALYSGAIKGPVILGNLANDNENTWGKGGVVPQLGRQLGLNDMASTIAYLLRTTSPVTSASSLVTIDSDGTVNPLIEKTRIV